MDESKKLLPENDMQELWEQNGRVGAVVEYIKMEENIPQSVKSVLLAMMDVKDEGFWYREFDRQQKETKELKVENDNLRAKVAAYRAELAELREEESA